MQLKTKQNIDNFLGKLMVAIHLPLVKGLGKLLRINHQLNKPPSEILVIKMLGFGSLLLSADALLALKKKYPNAKLTLIGSQNIKEGAALLSLFDEILVINDANVYSLFSSAIKVVKYCAFRKNKWCFDFEVYSRLTTLFSLYTFSKNRFGFEFEKVHFRNYLNTHNVYFNHFVPTEENYNTMAATANAEVKTQYLLPFERGSAGDTVFINNSCSTLSLQRKMEVHQLISIIQYLEEKSDLKIVLLGAPQDFEDNEAVINQLPKKGRVENWAGKYNFKEIIAKQAAHAKLLITIDSAPLHIGARLAIPMISIWGPTQPQSLAPKWLRESKDYHEVNLQVHCSPCVHHTKELPCKGNNFCIKDINLGELKALIAHVLE